MILCKELKNYCISRMNDRQIINYIPLHYVVPVQEKAREKGLKVPEPELIRNVRHKKQFDRQIVDILVELARKNRNDLKMLSMLYDRSEKAEIVSELAQNMNRISTELLQFPMVPEEILESEKQYYMPAELMEITRRIGEMSRALTELANNYRNRLNAA